MEDTLQKPLLAHLDEFHTLLADYKPSADSLQLLRDTRVVLLTAPTSGGRNTIIAELEKSGHYHYMVSDTTRPMRMKDGVLVEKDGREYWFKSEADVLEGLRSGKYVEAEVIHEQQVSGTNISELKLAHDKDQIAITDVDHLGIGNFYRLKPDVVCILVLPPTFNEWMQRLNLRAEMDDDELRRRLRSALKIVRNGLETDYIKLVINDKLEDSVNQVHHLAMGGQADESEQADAREHATKLIADIENYLTT